MTLEDAYWNLLTPTGWTDIQANIPTIEQAVADTNAKIVVELGVRWCASTIVLLHALEETGGQLWSVDMNMPTGPLFQIARDNDRWHFIRGDDCAQPLLNRFTDNVDIVLIDTTHGKEQTWNELVCWKPKMRSYGQMLLHDSELEHPETAPADDPPFPVKEAMREFTDWHGLRYDLDRKGYGMAVVYV